MKMKIFKITILSAAFISLVSCINGDDYDAPDLNGTCAELTVTKQVVDFTSTSTATYTHHTGNDVIEAYVTSSDEGGNFYKSISMVSLDGTQGFSMPIDNYNLYTKYEPGRKVYVNMKDRYFVKEHSGTVIGNLYNNNTPNNPADDKVGRISGVEYQSIITRSCSKINENTIVKNLTIAQAKNNQYLNMLIEIDAVQFTDASNGKKFYDSALNSFGGATNHNITDLEGNTLIVRVSEYANFASALTPNKNGKIRGVLTKYNNDFQFMVRTINDVKFNNPRIVAFFSEDFQTATNNTNLDIPGWRNFAEEGVFLWRERTFQGNGYAELSAFNSGSASNKVWLITPAINMNAYSNEIMVFKIAQHHLDVNSPDNSLQVLISTNFNGTNVLAATWTPINTNIPTMSTPWYQFLGSSVNLSNYTGNIHVAFKFIGSGTNTTLDGAFQVDDVKVYGGQ